MAGWGGGHGLLRLSEQGTARKRQQDCGRVHDGDSDNLMVGRNGIFKIAKGRGLGRHHHNEDHDKSHRLGRRSAALQKARPHDRGAGGQTTAAAAEAVHAQMQALAIHGRQTKPSQAQPKG